MRFRTSSFVLAACVIALAACDNPQQKEARYIRHGNELFDQGDYEKARIEYKNAEKIAPTAAEPRYRIGLVDEVEGDLLNAFGNYVAAEQQDPHFHPGVLKVAQYYMAAEKYDETHRRINAVLSEDAKDPEAHALNAAVALREKDYDTAEKEAHTALEEDPANVDAASALTGIYSAQNQFDKAVGAVDDGIKHNPENLALMMLRVLLYEHMDDLPHIAESYQSIFKLKPDEAKFRADLASIYVKAGKPDDAEATLRAGIAALPGDWGIKYQLVLFLADQRGADAAEKQIRDWMAEYPKNDDLYFWLADLYASHGNVDKATALLQQILERGAADNASSLNARNLLARIDIKQGNRDLAQKLVTAVLEKAPDDAPALFLRANMSFENGDYQSTVGDLRNILRNDPKNRDALQLLGETLLVQGHLDLAIDTMKKLGDLDPTNLPVRVRLAQMVELNGDEKQAMDLVTLVTKAAPDYAVGWESAARFAIAAREWLPAQEAIRTLDKIDGQHLTAAFLEGQIFEETGKSEDAVAKYKEVISADPKTPLAEHALIALLKLSAKQNQTASLSTYLEGLKSDSPFVETMLAKCYAMTGKIDDSKTQLDKAIAANAIFPEPYLDRAELYVADHKIDLAIDVLKKGTQAAPSDVRAAMREADLLTMQDHPGEAIAIYQTLLAHNPGLDPAANNLAEIIADYQYGDSAALENARQIAERFAGSTNPLLLDTLAWVYYRQNNIPQAQTVMERVVALGDPHTLPAQVHYHYGAILAKEGKKDQSKVELTEAVHTTAAYPGLDDAKKILSGL